MKQLIAVLLIVVYNKLLNILEDIFQDILAKDHISQLS